MTKDQSASSKIDESTLIMSHIEQNWFKKKSKLILVSPLTKEITDSY